MANIDDIILHGIQIGKAANVDAETAQLALNRANQALTELEDREPSLGSGAAGEYLADDKTWKNFTSSVRSALMTGLNNTIITAVIATDSLIEAIGKLQGQISELFTDVANKAYQTDVDNSLFLKVDKNVAFLTASDLTAIYPNSHRVQGATNQLQITDGGPGQPFIISFAPNPVIPGTAGITLPGGTTAQRPAVPSGIDLRFNNDFRVVEYFNNGEWLNFLDSSVTKDTNDLTGFTTRATSTISFDPITRTLTLAPTAEMFEFYHAGRRSQHGEMSIQIADTDGMHFLQIDNTGTFVDLGGPIYDNVLVAAVVWNKTQQRAVLFADERHGTSMPPLLHHYLHTTRGTQYRNGLLAGNYSTIGSGNVDADAQISISDGGLWDEDLPINIFNNGPQILFPVAQMPIWYRNGAAGIWFIEDAENHPLKVGAERICYNSVDGSDNWFVTEAPADGFIAMWIVATNDVNNPMISVMGQFVSDTLDEALAENTIATFKWGVAPVAEYKILYRVIFETKSIFNNTAKAALRHITDVRAVEVLSSSTGTTATHAGMSGLNSDDHLIYVHVSAARVITAQHTFNPSTPMAPFVLGANAQGQLIPGLNASLLNSLTSLDFIRNLGNVPSLTAGLFADRPDAGIDGRVYIARDKFQIHQDNGSDWDVIAIGAGFGGTILQNNTSSIAPTSGITTKIDANVTPAIIDGTLIWSHTITPTSLSSKITLKGAAHVDHTNNNRRIVFAIFRDSTCIGVASTNVSQAGNGVTLVMNFNDAPNTTDPVTYSIRCWANAAGTWYVGHASVPLFNGMLAKQTINLQEIV